ncbi:M14 family zinc carboxypeptidase [Mucilaginibacter sp. PAMB04274]|uniref:M14 family zinc carboxypeptidase n=1 Tax=Mucilaginibacter sp. PAMB04274 TaxID=3138568 RepID=UPI0031F66933
MNNINSIDHTLYKESLFTNRIIKHSTLKDKVNKLRSHGLFKVDVAGYSAQQREIYSVTLGHGSTSVLLWSQMHGDEPTGTLAFFDLFNFFAANDEHKALREHLLNTCTLHFIPMVNPDGAELYQRRNAQGIDINRDFLQQQSPEAQLLARLQQEVQPEFGFNMHDQESLWSVAGTKQPASISLLAPPCDAAATVTPERLKAIQVISSISEMLNELIPGQVGRWSEDFEPRAFGDNFQRLGTATILVEAGGHHNDPERQLVRKLNFDVVLHALNHIATGQYRNQSATPYYNIPTNSKELFHIIIKNCKVATYGGTITVDVGLNYTEKLDPESKTLIKTYAVTDMGDLSVWNAYHRHDANGAVLSGALILDEKANLNIIIDDQTHLVFVNGLLIQQ